MNENYVFIPTHVCLNSLCPTNNYAGVTWNPFSKEDDSMVDQQIGCEYCGMDLFKIENYANPRKYEIVIFENKSWKITSYPSLKSGWILCNNLAIGDNWVRYENGSFAFDNPTRLPLYIKDAVKNLIPHIEKKYRIEGK